MARYKRSSLINANRYAAAQSHVLKAASKRAKMEIKKRRIQAAIKAGLISESAGESRRDITGKSKILSTNRPSRPSFPP
jgi:hypothetical protein